MVAPRKDFNDYVEKKELQIGDFVIFMVSESNMPTGKILALNQDGTALVQELKSGTEYTIPKVRIARIQTDFPKGRCERAMSASF